jgi:UTP-glucose-1-phosphate uridylyltransferase
VVEIIERDLKLSCLTLTIKPGIKVRKAVIPAAGFGGSLFPSSKAMKKELFPIVDRDGIAKPAILLIVEEALDAGIEEVIIIVQDGDLDAFRSFFTTQVSIENYNKLSPAFQDYSRHILEIGQRVSYVIQPTQEGFGHAIYTAREAVGDEPFLLLLGDHVYRSDSSKSCSSQLLEAFDQHDTSVIGLRRTPEDMIASFGTVTGTWIDDEGHQLNVNEIVEKPTVDYARSNLQVAGLAEGDYLTVFGQYVIKPQLFDYLKEDIENNLRDRRGGFQLTPALDRLRREDGILGQVVDGQRFDIGMPEHYLETLRAFSQG